MSARGWGELRPIPNDPVETITTPKRRGFVAVKCFMWLAVAVIGWYLFAPVQLGGYDRYVLTRGTSMLPSIHGGALVITREQSSYRVGEIAAYHNSAMGGAVVLHRIVAIHDGHYTFKGDNNRQADLYPPTSSALIGAKWIYWAGGGTLMTNLGTPWIGGPLLGLLGMWAVADVGRRKKGGIVLRPVTPNGTTEHEGKVVLRTVAAKGATQTRRIGAAPLR
jgi:signal peptidase I